MNPFLITAISGFLLFAPLQAQQPDPGAQAITEMETAVARVKEIVNQPVTQLPIAQGDKAALFRPGWFHAGANTPDFDHVDVRTSQECAQYARWPYVTSDITPGTMFIGSELEFNAMTKFFYTDRSQPKKKLTEQEMLEINDLYRIIGKCLKQIRALRVQPRGPGNTVPDTKAMGMMAPLVLSVEATPVGEKASPIQKERNSEGLMSPWTLGAMGLVLVLLLAWVRVRKNHV